MVLLGAVGFVAIATFSITVIMGQAYLPSRPGLACGVTLGLAIELGGVAATAAGSDRRRHGLRAVLWTIALLPVPALLLALRLPPLPGRPTRSGGRTPAAVRFRRP